MPASSPRLYDRDKIRIETRGTQSEETDRARRTERPSLASVCNNTKQILASTSGEILLESHLTVHDSESTPLSEGNIFQKLATKTAQPDPDRATHAAAADDADADDETRGRADDDGE